MNKVIELKTGLKGIFNVRKYKRINGKKVLTYEQGWRENLIVNGGLDQIGTTTALTTILGSAKVGTGTTAPANANTALETVLLTNSSVSTSDSGRTTATPFYAFIRQNFVFNEGQGNNNITEFGVFQSTTMFSRSLFKDEFGDPITISWLNDEILEIVYELRFYPPTEAGIDVGTFFIGAVEYAYYAAAIWTAWGALPGSSRYFFNTISVFETSGNVLTTSLPDIPSASAQTSHSTVNFTYTAGNYYRDVRLSLGLAVANYSTGIGGMRAIEVIDRSNNWHIQFNPKIPKTVDNKLIITFRQSWARKV